MAYHFECKLMDKILANNFIHYLHRPEPSGYGALPPKSMNLAWGVIEKNTNVFLTKSYKDEYGWKGKEGEHLIIFDIKCKEGYFSAGFETNAYLDYYQYACAMNDNLGLFKNYADVVKQGIKYYMHEHHENFFNLFEKSYGESIFSYEKRIHEKIYQEWYKRWNH